MSRSDFFRHGFGFGSREDEGHVDNGRGDSADAVETDQMIPPDDPERARQLQEAIRREQRLHAELRAAGLL